jgi:hypothetical protein
VEESRYKHDLSLLNRLIRPLPAFIGYSNLINRHSLLGKRKKFRGSKRRDLNAEQQFHTLSLKMIGLTNMLSLMNVTKHRVANKLLSNNLGGISNDLAHGGSMTSNAASFMYMAGLLPKEKSLVKESH